MHYGVWHQKVLACSQIMKVNVQFSSDRELKQKLDGPHQHDRDTSLTTHWTKCKLLFIIGYNSQSHLPLM